MALTLSTQGIVSGAFASNFTNGMAFNASGTIYYPAVSLLAAAGTIFDPATLMPSSGGSVTANSGTNLNTSALALESGGNLASILTKLNASVAVTGTFWQATQPVSGSVTANLGTIAGVATAANQPTNAAQGSTTSGQTGHLAEGAVTTSAPVYATGQTNPLSLDTAGNLRVNVTTGGVSGNVGQGSTTAGETGVMIQGAVTTGSPTYTTAQTSPISLTTAGAVRTDASATTQPISGSVTVVGRTTMVTVTPTVTSNGAYSAGNEIGGLMTFAIGGAGSGELKSVRVTSKTAGLMTALQAYIFTTNPTNSTWTNLAAPAINTADIAGLLCCVNLSDPASGLGTMTIWNTGNIGAQFVGANLYVVLVAVAGATLGSTSTADITVELGVKDD